MSHSSKIFEEAPIQVQNKNGFDLSHLNCGTSKCGQLVPVLCKLLPPNSDFTLGVNLEVNLPPLATTFFGRIDAIVEGFVVPCSILYGGWKNFITNNPVTSFPQSQSSIDTIGFELPYLHFRSSEAQSDWGVAYALDSKHDALFDYLGARIEYSTNPEYSFKLNLLPFLAYHLIWDVYYRNKQITKTIFAVNPNTDSGVQMSKKNVSLVWHSFYSRGYQSTQGNFDVSNFATTTFPDGKYVFATRQRNYSRDYFTAGVPSPQQGTASKLRFAVESSSGEFTISALRAANSLQKFLETNNLSQDYAEMMRNRWGTRPIDADFDEPYYLGRTVVPVYQKSVYQQDSSSKESAVNPFASMGAIATKGASGSFNGEGSITDKFHNTTWAYVMCLFSLVPHAAYGQGLNRELSMLEIGDFPSPEFQSIGYENILNSELVFSSAYVGQDEDFAYIPRYSRFKYMDDEIHGEMRQGNTLQSFVLQRVFSTTPALSTQFLEIPQTALDDVFAVDTENMNLSCWYEIFFSFKVSMPLADFCIPTLGELKDTHTIKTSVGGSRL